MSTEIRQMSIREALISYRRAFTQTSDSDFRRASLVGLDVAKRFDELFPNASGYIFDLSKFKNVLPFLPPTVFVITNPQIASEVMVQGEFKFLTSDTPTHRAFKPSRGEFILSRGNEEQWKKEKVAANHVYGYSEIDIDKVKNIAKDAVDSSLATSTNRFLPKDWTKYLVFYQIVKHLTSGEIEPKKVFDAIRAHSFYTRNGVIPLVVGNAPGRIREFLSTIILKKYYSAIDSVLDLADGDIDNSGMLNQVISYLPEEDRNPRDIAFTLVAGLSTIRSYIDFTLHALAKYPEYQGLARTDLRFLENFIREVGRMNPLVPYIVRKAEEPFELLNTRIKKGSYVIFGWFAFANNKNVEDADSFNPYRNGLDRMSTAQGGEANVFSYGPRSCLARHFSPMILSSTITEILNRFTIRCDNDPKPVMGGVALRYNEPLKIILIDRRTGMRYKATSAY